MSLIVAKFEFVFVSAFIKELLSAVQLSIRWGRKDIKDFKKAKTTFLRPCGVGF